MAAMTGLVVMIAGASALAGLDQLAKNRVGRRLAEGERDPAPPGSCYTTPASGGRAAPPPGT
jgi:hypothetical protein